MTVTLTNAPPPFKDDKAASPRSGRQSKTSPVPVLQNLLVDQSCSPLLRALCVATLLSVLAVLALTAEREDAHRPERTARAGRLRVAVSPLTTLTELESADDAPTDDTALDSDFSIEQAALTWSHRLEDSDASDTPGVMRFGPVKVHQSIVERVVKAAQTTEMDPALLMAIADKESNFSATAKARTSSASGLFQFVEKTWLKAVKAFGWRHGHGETAAAIASADAPRISGQKRAQILNLRNDPYLSAVLAAEMLKKDSARIAEKIGRPLTSGETYLIHFLGPDDAERFMRTLEQAPQSSAAALLPRPARANKPIFYEQQGRRLKVRSVHEVHEAFETMMDKRTSRYEDVAAKLPAGATAYAD
ncbi:MAG: transglycosylase SLT domain-containing protein [Methylocystis sp.]|uniref:transglycosylase SLT domain-containing protein n=1 Tax=Methylocystis sp. TaxID=1911079 RepID=UPI003D09E380